MPPMPKKKSFSHIVDRQLRQAVKEHEKSFS